MSKKHWRWRKVSRCQTARAGRRQEPEAVAMHLHLHLLLWSRVARPKRHDSGRHGTMRAHLVASHLRTNTSWKKSPAKYEVGGQRRHHLDDGTANNALLRAYSAVEAEHGDYRSSEGVKDCVQTCPGLQRVQQLRFGIQRRPRRPWSRRNQSSSGTVAGTGLASSRVFGAAVSSEVLATSALSCLVRRMYVSKSASHYPQITTFCWHS